MRETLHEMHDEQRLKFIFFDFFRVLRAHKQIQGHIPKQKIQFTLNSCVMK